MEIKNYLNAVKAYSSTKYEKSKTESNQSSNQVKNTDRIEFSSNRVSNIQSLKTSISEKVERSASPERISELSRSINNGQYNVQAELVARAILE